MNDSNKYPRVNGSMMRKHLNRTVIFLGECIEPIDSNRYRMKSSDNQEVIVIIPPGEQFTGKYVQVLGVVRAENEIEILNIIGAGTDYDESFDMSNYNKAIELASEKYSALYQ